MTKLYVALDKGLAVIEQRNGAWTASLHLAESSPQSIAVDPQRPQRLYCATFRKGLWRSDDGGNSWERLENGITQQQMIAVAVSSVERIDGYGVVYAGSEPSALFRSEDGGESWQELPALLRLPSASTWSFPPRPYTSHVRWITPDPLVAGRVFVAIEAGALVRSLDGGRTWEDRRPDGPYDTHTLVMHRQAPNRLYSAAGDGFMHAGNGFVVSDNGGDTWYRPDEGLHHHYLWSVAADPADPATLVISAAASPGTAHNPAQAESALYRRSGSSPWQLVSAGLPPARGTQTSVLAVHEAEPGVFYAANNNGIFRSADTGQTWESIPIRWPQTEHLGRAHSLVVMPE
ncbi:MAG: glycosyl hydrolase [Ktedonobacteraceae bacterium]|nr:glycosyl hydrolase [Ktedonobacteraceae bacterium]